MFSVARIAPEARSRESALLLEGYLRKDGSRGVTGKVKGQGRTWEGFGKDSGRIQEGFKNRKLIGTLGKSWRTKGLPPSRYFSCIVR